MLSKNTASDKGMSKKKRLLLVIFALLFASVFVYCGVVVLREYIMRERDSETFDELSELIQLPEVNEEIIRDDVSQESNDVSEEVSDENASSALPEIVHKRNLKPIIERNSDCIGWLYIEDSEVDYPVMHTPNDPEKYIDLSFDWKYSAYGVPFLDYRCTPDCDNIVIYGHNMKDGSMFATVRRFMDEEYFYEHPYIEFETVEGCKTYSVFAIVSVKASDDWYSYHHFDEATRFTENVNRLISKSLYKTDVMPQYGKQIITLSTCYGVERDDRIILLAVEE